MMSVDLSPTVDDVELMEEDPLSPLLFNLIKIHHNISQETAKHKGLEPVYLKEQQAPFTVLDCEKTINGHHIVTICTQYLVHEHDSVYTQTIEEREEVVLKEGQDDVIEKFAGEGHLFKGAIVIECDQFKKM